MKKFASLFLVMTLFAPIFAAAQDDPLTESYEGEDIRFSYPAGWIVAMNEEGSATLKNMAFDTSQLGAEVPSGAIEIQVSPFVLEDASTEIINLSADDPEYALGYVAGLFSIADLLALGFAGEELAQFDIGVPMQIEIANFDAIYSVSSITNDRLIVLLFHGSEFAATIYATSPGGEMTQWTDLIFAIAETIELSEEVITQTEGPPPATASIDITDETMTAAWQAMLTGDPEPAKALSCEADHENIAAAAEALGDIAEAGIEVGVTCEVMDETVTCEIIVAGESQEIVSDIVDGKICGEALERN